VALEGTGLPLMNLIAVVGISEVRLHMVDHVGLDESPHQRTAPVATS